MKRTTVPAIMQKCMAPENGYPAVQERRIKSKRKKIVSPSISWMEKKAVYPFFQRFNVGKYRVISAMASSLV